MDEKLVQLTITENGSVLFLKETCDAASGVAPDYIPRKISIKPMQNTERNAECRRKASKTLGIYSRADYEVCPHRRLSYFVRLDVFMFAAGDKPPPYKATPQAAFAEENAS